MLTWRPNQSAARTAGDLESRQVETPSVVQACLSELQHHAGLPAPFPLCSKFGELTLFTQSFSEGTPNKSLEPTALAP